MTRRARTLGPVLAPVLLLLAACAPATISADVTRFSALPPGGGAESFAVVPDKQQAGSLEFGEYANLVAGQLQARGWRPAPTRHQAAAVVRIHWGVGAPVSQVWSVPYDWGPGPWPWYGGGYWPYGGETYSTTAWPKTLSVEILDGRAWRAGETRMIWQGRAVAAGQSPAITPAMPYLVQALFTGFPGNNAQTVRVEVPVGQ